MSFLTNGHAASCGVPNGPCTCPTLYLWTGALAIFAGSLQILFGYWSSLALLSDGLHAGADGAADLLVAVIAVWILQKPHLGEMLEKIGRKIIALALVGSALWVIAEAIERGFAGTHTVVPWVLAAGGAGGALIDALRLSLLRKAQDAAPDGLRSGLISHARMDFYRSIIAAGIGVALVTGEIAFMSPEFKGAVAHLDLALSAGLSLYMFYLAKGIWRGEHVHNHEHGSCGHHH